MQSHELRQPLLNAHPQHSRRSTWRKKPDATEAEVERRLIDVTLERRLQSLFDCGIGTPEEKERQVHPIGTHPRCLHARHLIP
jgi:hypothetical protein